MNTIGLPQKESKKLAEELNILLSNFQVYYQNLRGLHWNIRGRRFFDLHLKFEELYNDAQLKIDLIAERVLTLEGVPFHTFSDYIANNKLPIGKNKNLYEFWKTTITKQLNSELEKGELFVNLASNEYFDAVDVKKLKVPVITPEFKDYKDGKLKMISFFAKKARGMMVRFIIETNAETIEDLKAFNYEGYAFDANLSTEKKLVFTR